MAPFLGALAVIVLAVIVVVLLNSFGTDGRSEEQKVSLAAVGQNDALQRADFADYATYTCAAEVGEESKVLDTQQRSVATDGQRYIDGISGVTIDGDTATGTVTYHFDKTPDDKVDIPTTFVREDGRWKVCTPAQ